MNIEKDIFSEQINEKIKIEVEVIPQTAQEEFSYLKYILGKKEFFKRHGYKNVTIPDDNKFQKIWNSEEKINENNLNNLEEYFQTNIYNLDFFQKSLEQIQKDTKNVDKILTRVENWGEWFKKFSKYNIKLTAYGPGGSYDYSDGNIFIKTNKDGNFWKPPLETIIHEIIHIGIEESIIHKYNLT